MQPKLIIFDCDGVLVDTEAISTGVITQLARALGVPISNQEALETFTGTSLNFVQDFLEKKLGKKLPEDFEPVYRKKTFEEFEKNLQPISGIHAIVENLAIPFCVASNAPIYKVEFNLKLTNLYPFFEGKIFSAYQVEKWKPDPTLFLTAAKTMGFRPEECMVVEDSAAGVLAAKAAKMKVLGYAHGEKAERLKSHGATIITDVAEILNFL
ncbi:MAG: HAD-IA family hydrolase [Bacteroidota bacterium]